MSAVSLCSDGPSNPISQVWKRPQFNIKNPREGVDIRQMGRYTFAQ